EIEPMPVRPARADSRLGAQSASGACVPPTRRLWTASWRSEASAARNISWMYSETMKARLPARVEALFSVCARHHHRSTARNAASDSSTPTVRPAMRSLRTCLLKRSGLELGEGVLRAMSERRFEVGAAAQIAQQVGDGEAAGLLK